MNKKSLYKFGGISAFIAVAILGVLDLSNIFGWNLGTASVPAFSIFITIYVIFLIAGYEYLTGIDYGMAKIGGAFGALLMITLFIEVAAISADQILLSNDNSIDPLAMSEMDGLFTSSHTLAVWFHAIWMTCWGFALLRSIRSHKTIGVLMLAFAGIYVVYYWVDRLASYQLAETVHMIGHVPLLISHVMLGSVLLSANET